MTVARTASWVSIDPPIAFQIVVRRLFTPKWILIHIGVALLIALMMNLGFWQLSRLDEKKSFNALLRSHTNAPIVQLSEVPLQSTKEYEWRRVSVAGTYVMDKAVTIINRSQNGTAGYDSLVPLQLEGGKILFVNRGFIPLATPVSPAPTGPVTVVGYIRAPQTRSGLGPVDSSDVNNTEFQRFDIELIGKRITNASVIPVFLQRISEEPASTSQWPATVELPTLDNGPHLSYAVQWFFFCAVAATAWVVVVRRRLRQSDISEDSPVHTSF